MNFPIRTLLIAGLALSSMVAGTSAALAEWITTQSTVGAPGKVWKNTKVSSAMSPFNLELQCWDDGAYNVFLSTAAPEGTPLPAITTLSVKTATGATFSSPVQVSAGDGFIYLDFDFIIPRLVELTNLIAQSNGALEVTMASADGKTLPVTFDIAGAGIAIPTFLQACAAQLPAGWQPSTGEGTVGIAALDRATSTWLNLQCYADGTYDLYMSVPIMARGEMLPVQRIAIQTGTATFAATALIESGNAYHYIYFSGMTPEQVTGLVGIVAAAEGPIQLGLQKTDGSVISGAFNGTGSGAAVADLQARCAAI